MENKELMNFGPSGSNDGYILVRGARENNLKDVNLSIPRNTLVVFSGISGSGKSSLAFGTIYAEAQRRYFESIAPYARRLLDQVGVPEVDDVEGLPPAVALKQQNGVSNGRSTVGSLTSLSNLVRMMYSRAGIYPPHQKVLYADDFSPNTPQGACSFCHGMGHTYDVVEDRMVPDRELSISQKAIASWPSGWQGQNLRDILVSLGYDVDTPWKNLSEEDRQWILFSDDTPNVPVYPGLTSKETRNALRAKIVPGYMGTFISAKNYLLQTLSSTQSSKMRKRVSQFLEEKICPSCEGKKIKKESLSITLVGIDIGDFMQKPISNLITLLSPVSNGDFTKYSIDKYDSGYGESEGYVLSTEKKMVAQRLSKGILTRLYQLQKLGLDYLTLGRMTSSLSAGELQRLRLATQLSSVLFGVVYVLDEPTAGLHPSDRDALYNALDDLVESGNSLFVVEHDLELMRRAKWLVDVGPMAGEQGGYILYSGVPDGIRDIAQSATARYLFGRLDKIESFYRKPSGYLKLRNISKNNLKGINIDIPLGVLTAVTGVSGSGKSSLISQALPELLSPTLENGSIELLTQSSDKNEDYDELITLKASGVLDGDTSRVKRLVEVNQKPIGRTPRSNLATYTGLFDPVRKLFAGTSEAKLNGYDAGRFSFNVAKGRCDKCAGEGFVSVELLFMPSVYAPCPTCHGARYNQDTLAIKWRDKNIAEVLRMTVDEACQFFIDHDQITRPLTLLSEIGLGYLRLGQPATELSGGEAQRIKLVTELQRTQSNHTLYILDEPTTGLHASDADKLLIQLQKLVEIGNTVIMIEHDMRSVLQSDFVIDIGPGAGNYGGKLVAQGTPEEVSKNQASITAKYIARELSRYT